MSVNACIRRQGWAKLYKKEVTDKPVHDHSLITCQMCTTGKKVIKNPDCFINRDYQSLKNKHLQTIRCRGWLFKDGISYESLFDSFNYTMIKKGGNNNGENSAIFKLNQQERINRFVRKHRRLARSK